MGTEPETCVWICDEDGEPIEEWVDWQCGERDEHQPRYRCRVCGVSQCKHCALNDGPNECLGPA